MLEKIVKKYSPSRVLDVASGKAKYVTELVSEYSGTRFVTTDYKANSAVNFVRADAKQLGFPNDSFELVSCFNAFYHFLSQPNGYSALGELHRVSNDLVLIGPLKPYIGVLPDQPVDSLVEGKDVAGLKELMDTPLENVFDAAGFEVLETFPFKADRSHYLLRKNGECSVKPLFKTWLPHTLLSELHLVK